MREWFAVFAFSCCGRSRSKAAAIEPKLQAGAERGDRVETANGSDSGLVAVLSEPPQRRFSVPCGSALGRAYGENAQDDRARKVAEHKPRKPRTAKAENERQRRAQLRNEYREQPAEVETHAKTDGQVNGDKEQQQTQSRVLTELTIREQIAVLEGLQRGDSLDRLLSVSELSTRTLTELEAFVTSAQSRAGKSRKRSSSASDSGSEMETEPSRDLLAEIADMGLNSDDELEAITNVLLGEPARRLSRDSDSDLPMATQPVVPAALDIKKPDGTAAPAPWPAADNANAAPFAVVELAVETVDLPEEVAHQQQQQQPQSNSQALSRAMDDSAEGDSQTPSATAATSAAQQRVSFSSPSAGRVVLADRAPRAVPLTATELNNRKSTHKLRTLTLPATPRAVPLVSVSAVESPLSGSPSSRLAISLFVEQSGSLQLRVVDVENKEPQLPVSQRAAALFIAARRFEARRFSCCGHDRHVYCSVCRRRLCTGVQILLSCRKTSARASVCAD